MKLPILLLFFAILKESLPSPAETVECVGCIAAVEAFKFIYGRNATKDAIINIASYICKNFVKHDSIVCYGLAAEFREEILYVLENLILRPGQICGMFIQNCGKYKDPFADWTIPLPEKPAGQSYPSYPPIQQENLRVLQISDIHVDSQYTAGTVANCGSPLCCQPSSVLNETKKVEAGYWGTLAACDIPYRTFDAMLRHINKTEQLDYIMMAGDYMSHSDWAYTKRNHLSVITNLTSLMNEYFPGIPIYWALGNHEGVPVNSFAPHYIPEKFRPQWLYDKMRKIQHRWIHGGDENDITFRGSYITQIFDGLRLISLNTGYCETTNFWLYLNQTDPDGTLSWLVKELIRAEKDLQYVQILAHIPPGNEECLEGWAKNYYNIVNRFSNTIVGQFFGHIHIDSFTVFYENLNDDASKPTSVLYAAPSVTTFSNLNPAYRIYDIEPGIKYRVTDFRTYFFNLSNSDPEMDPKWELLYSAKNEYSLKDLSPASWDRLSDEVLYSEKAFKRLLRNAVRRDNYVCDKRCRYELLCGLRKGHHNNKLCSHIGLTHSIFSAYPLQSRKNGRSERLSFFKNNSHFAPNILADIGLQRAAKQFSSDAKKAFARKLFSVPLNYTF